MRAIAAAAVLPLILACTAYVPPSAFCLVGDYEFTRVQDIPPPALRVVPDYWTVRGDDDGNCYVFGSIPAQTRLYIPARTQRIFPVHVQEEAVPGMSRTIIVQNTAAAGWRTR